MFFSTELVLYFKVCGLLFFIHLFLPAGRVLMMLGKAQFELQKFVDSYVNSFDIIVKLYYNILFQIHYTVYCILYSFDSVLADILTSVFFPFFNSVQIL